MKEVYKQWKMFGLFFYVSSIRMKRRRTIDEQLRNKNKTLRRYKKMLYAEQEGCCAQCGTFFVEDGLEIHHLVGVKEAPNLMLAKKNMVLLCPHCHREIHRVGGGKRPDSSINNNQTDRSNGELQ